MNVQVNGVTITLTKGQLAQVNKVKNTKQTSVKSYKDITSFEIACKHLGESLSKFKDKVKGLNPSEVALRELKVIVRAIRSFTNWSPNLNDSTQYKYWNYFYMKGGVFSYYHTDYANGNMDVPSALFVESYEQSKFLANTFLEKYRIYYTED